jgi:protein O-GlcNAc transferase
MQCRLFGAAEPGLTMKASVSLPMDNIQKLFDAATLAEEAGQVKKALRLYEKAAAIDKDAPGLRIRWAGLLYDQGRWLEAIKIARQVIRRRPKVYLAYSLIGESYLKLGYLLRAERAFRQALSVKPRAGTWVFLSSMLARLGRDEESEACLRSALTVDPQYEEAHYNLGYIYRFRGRSDEPNSI